MTLTDTAPMVPEDFQETQDDILCFFCNDNLVDPTTGKDACMECGARHGDVCSSDGCMADTLLITEEGHMCERHAVLYLQELVADAFSLVQKLQEEEDILHDKFLKLERLKDKEGNHTGEIQHQKYIFEQMNSNVTQKRDTLFSFRREINELQKDLEVEYVNFSTYTEYDE